MVVPGRLGLVDVIDRATGLPVEAGVTAVLLEPHEARELVRWLLRRAHAKGSRVHAEGGCVHAEGDEAGERSSRAA
jgi:hypothetical protein